MAVVAPGESYTATFATVAVATTDMPVVLGSMVATLALCTASGEIVVEGDAVASVGREPAQPDAASTSTVRHVARRECGRRIVGQRYRLAPSGSVRSSASDRVGVVVAGVDLFELEVRGLRVREQDQAGDDEWSDGQDRERFPEADLIRQVRRQQ